MELGRNDGGDGQNKTVDVTVATQTFEQRRLVGIHDSRGHHLAAGNDCHHPRRSSEARGKGKVVSVHLNPCTTDACCHWEAKAKHRARKLEGRVHETRRLAPGSSVARATEEQALAGLLAL